MERPLTPRSAEDVRGIIARAFLRHDTESRLGALRLRPHQRIAVARIRDMLRRLGGALLADEAGLGKTYVALAVAREARAPLIVCPAALVPMWRRACTRAGVKAPDVTYEALSRGRTLVPAHDLLVLDEAHHARTPGTRRYAALAGLAAQARVLLLSATPIHNRRADLAALLALFLGARAWSLEDGELARFVVRREHHAVGDVALPVLSAPEILHVGDDIRTLEAILALPPPVPPRDGGDGGALLTLSLVRQWASSDAALIAGVRQRLARAGALMHALEHGRHPTRHELAAWAYAEDSIQLAFPELLVSSASASAARLLETVREHAAATQHLLGLVVSRDSLDEVRVDLLREIRRRHPGQKVAAFAHFAETVLALFQPLCADGGVAALTSEGGLVAGGRLKREDLLACFAPRASGVDPPREAERIDFLLTTDLLSEGVNLQDASVVVHLDLPWTVARMEQRVGRSRRIGAAHARTTVYALAPPASAEEMLRIEHRLRAKLRDAAHAIGATGAILPGMESTLRSAPSSVSRREALLSRLAHWWRDSTPGTSDEETAVAAVSSARSGFMALARDDGLPLLFGSLDGEPVTDDAHCIFGFVTLAEGPDVALDASRTMCAADAAHAWLARRRAAASAGAARSIAGHSRRAAIQRIARITARLPHHRRPALLPLVARARQAVTAQFGIGAERVLDQLAAAAMPDDAWLRAVSAFGDIHDQSSASAPARSASALVAVLLLRADHD